MRYSIFLNIKRWLIEYGTEILDILLSSSIKDKNIIEPRDRYNNFYHELNRHFTYVMYSKSNFNEHLPLLVAHIHDLGYSGNCFHQYMIDFKFVFTTISLDQEDLVENTPEYLLEIQDKLDCLLSEMMSSRIFVDNKLVSRTVFSDLYDLDDFDNKLTRVSSIEEYPLVYTSTEKEINTLNKQFLITIGECTEW